MGIAKIMIKNANNGYNNNFLNGLKTNNRKIKSLLIMFWLIYPTKIPLDI